MILWGGFGISHSADNRVLSTGWGNYSGSWTIFTLIRIGGL